jgi:carboxymethylenebutenolidase
MGFLSDPRIAEDRRTDMTGRIIEFNTDGAPATGYLATPETGTGPGVVVLHAWWGLTEPFRQISDRLADAGFVAIAPDLYHGKTATTVEEAEALADALTEEKERVRGDLRGAVQYLHQHAGPGGADSRDKLGVVGFSLGGAYALDMSVNLPDEIAAVVIFYATYTGLDYRRAQAAYLYHFAEDDPYESPESVAEMEHELQVVGKRASLYTYVGTTHWFFEANRPDAYDPAAASLAWERTVAFLNAELRR